MPASVAIASSELNGPAFVTYSIGGSRDAALALAHILGLPFSDSISAADVPHLVQTVDAVELHDPASRSRLRVEFTENELKRYRAGSSGPDPLRRAIGPLSGNVVDATGGLGRDAVHLAVLGYPITAIEQNAVAGALVRDGLRRACANGLLPENNPVWLTGDSRILLRTLDPAPAVVYLDPMFPPKRKKSAAVRKEMRLLRWLVADGGEPLALLIVARSIARERVVVKRPIEAAPLASNPTASYRGKLVRYDVYRTST